MKIGYFKPILYYLVVTSLVAATSCNEIGKEDSKKQYLKAFLRKSKNLVLELDSVTPGYSWHLQYIELDSIELLAYQNRLRNEIAIFDLKNNEQVSKVIFDKTGPQGIGKLMGFHVIDPDSILVIGHMKSQLNYFDTDGSLIEKVLFERGNKRILFPMISPFLPYISIQDLSIFPVFPEGYWGGIKDFAKEPVAALTSNKTGTYKFSEVTYPLDYYKNGISEPIFSRIHVNNQFIYSFYTDHDLYITKDHNSFTKISSKSQWIGDFIPLKRNPSMDQYLKWISECPAYLGLLHDPYNKLIYRFVTLGYQPKEFDNLQETSRFHKNISLMVYDENLNLLGEQKLDPGKYYWQNSFVSKQGLFISTNSPFNKNFRSEKLNFQLFKILHNDY